MPRLKCSVVLFWLLTLTLIGHATGCFAQHPIVPGFEKFVEVEELNDVQRGLLLLNEMNCVACHQTGTEYWATAQRQAPILTGVANRLQHEFFQEYLVDPHAFKPGTTMPDVLNGKPDSEKKEIAANISHFLASLGQPVVAGANQEAARQGEKLFHTIGCVACHNPQNESVEFSTSVPLGNLSKKYTIPGLTTFLKNPHTVRPSGRMPNLNLDDKESKAVASYLLRDLKVEGNVNFKYFDGAWDELPDFDALKPASTGTSIGFDVKFGGTDNYGIVFEGFWQTDADAEYTFRLGSDDGSRLIIDDQIILDNDGVHPVTFVEKKIKVAAGIKRIRVEFFERAGGEDLKLTIKGDGLEQQDFAPFVRKERVPAKTDDQSGFVVDLDKAKTGRRQFVVHGCADCHSLKYGGTMVTWSDLENEKKPVRAPLDKLAVTGGCIDGNESAPFFSFSDPQKQALKAALTFIQQQTAAPTSDAEQRVHQAMLSYNCYACHSREYSNGELLGGVIDQTGDSFEVFGREKWFTSDQAEMGDEGRIPPYLKMVGAKLNKNWLEHVIVNGANDRPYMKTRMPRFGETVRGLVTDLMKADQLEPVAKVERTVSPRKLKLQAKKMLSGKALSCVKCHTFAGYKATGIQAMSLTTMTKRLDKDWFRAYMHRPSRFRRGTRMPESWPDGKSFFPDILDGDPDKQIDALWVYLEDGDQAEVPADLIQSKMELVADDHPVIYRNFIEGAGSRAIGIGYPEKVNLAFDAENSRLALLWQGAFMDAGRHWSGRGQGFERPLGGNVLQLEDKFPFTIIEPVSLPNKYVPPKPNFGGYKFDSLRRPTLMYSIRDIQIEDSPSPVKLTEGEHFVLSRKFVVTSEQKTSLWYRVAKGKEITKAEDGTYTIDGDWKTKIVGADTFILKANNSQVLYAVLSPSKDKTEFTQTYEW